jgi:DNA-binding transcriptional regulator YhcF (GntR family)
MLYPFSAILAFVMVMVCKITGNILRANVAVSVLKLQLPLWYMFMRHKVGTKALKKPTPPLAPQTSPLPTTSQSTMEPTPPVKLPAANGSAPDSVLRSDLAEAALAAQKAEDEKKEMARKMQEALDEQKKLSEQFGAVVQRQIKDTEQRENYFAARNALNSLIIAAKRFGVRAEAAQALAGMPDIPGTNPEFLQQITAKCDAASKELQEQICEHLKTDLGTAQTALQNAIDTARGCGIPTENAQQLLNLRPNPECDWDTCGSVIEQIRAETTRLRELIVARGAYEKARAQLAQAIIQANELGIDLPGVTQPGGDPGQVVAELRLRTTAITNQTLQLQQAIKAENAKVKAAMEAQIIDAERENQNARRCLNAFLSSSMVKSLDTTTAKSLIAESEGLESGGSPHELSKNTQEIAAETARLQEEVNAIQLEKKQKDLAENTALRARLEGILKGSESKTFSDALEILIDCARGLLRSEPGRRVSFSLENDFLEQAIKFLQETTSKRKAESFWSSLVSMGYVAVVSL